MIIPVKVTKIFSHVQIDETASFFNWQQVSFNWQQVSKHWKLFCPGENDPIVHGENMGITKMAGYFMMTLNIIVGPTAHKRANKACNVRRIVVHDVTLRLWSMFRADLRLTSRKSDINYIPSKRRETKDAYAQGSAHFLNF
jgi:hypothetical protein